MGHVQQADIAVAGQPHFLPQRSHGGFAGAVLPGGFPAQTQGVGCTFRTAVTGKELGAVRIAIHQGDINGFPQQIGQARRLRRFQRAYLRKRQPDIHAAGDQLKYRAKAGIAVARPVKCAAVPLPASICYGFQCGITVFINLTGIVMTSSDSTQTGCGRRKPGRCSP